ncbi:hypothetical protein DBR42_11215, partial [Pelomonas sp. HMWF004]
PGAQASDAGEAAPPVLWGRYGAQLAGMALVALMMGSLTFFFLGLVWVAQSLKERDRGWGRFGLGVVLMMIVVSLMGLFRQVP